MVDVAGTGCRDVVGCFVVQGPKDQRTDASNAWTRDFPENVPQFHFNVCSCTSHTSTRPP